MADALSCIEKVIECIDLLSKMTDQEIKDCTNEFKSSFLKDYLKNWSAKKRESVLDFVDMIVQISLVRRRKVRAMRDEAS